MTPLQVTQALSDALQIVTAAETANPIGVLVPAIDLLKQVIEALPPLDAPALDPVDRANADAAIEAEESKS
jgi:hypothetical protein